MLDGVRIAAPVARAPGAALDLAFVREAGAPSRPELAVGAVTDGEEMRVVFLRDVVGRLGLGDEDVRRLATPRALPRRPGAAAARGPHGRPRGRRHRHRRHGASGAAAGPAGGRDARVPGRARGPTRDATRAREAYEVVCLEAPRRFWAVGARHCDFMQVSDEEVVALLGGPCAGPEDSIRARGA